MQKADLLQVAKSENKLHAILTVLGGLAEFERELVAPVQAKTVRAKVQRREARPQADFDAPKRRASSTGFDDAPRRLRTEIRRLWQKASACLARKGTN